MSFNRENVLWPSPDGTWNRGFFRVSWVDYDGDPEWDVEYDTDAFDWVSTGHATEEAARASWDGANPGGYAAFAEVNDYTRKLDRMAKEYREGR